ncbi:hypothetical protein KAH81_05155 [bacterium]|nr:hypothetical protein [bacterium]
MSEDHLKSRVISIHNFSRYKCNNCGIPILLKKVSGILSAKLDENSGKLYIIYDLDLTSYRDIEKILSLIGCIPDDTIWQHLKESFIRFAEVNEISNLESKSKTYPYSPMKEMDELLDSE